MELKCDCCGYIETFSDAEAAFEAGWDAEPHFHGYVSCSLCPAAFIVLGTAQQKHAGIHVRWERDGRPTEWSQETCLEPADRAPEALLDAILELFGNKET